MKLEVIALSGITLFPLLPLSGALPAAKPSTNFCFPGQSCYPSLEQLSSFNQSIGGKLFSQAPIEAVCYENDPMFDKQACSEMAQEQGSGLWRLDQFSAYQYTSTETCGAISNCTSLEPISNSTCGQGRIANYAVHAETADDVQKYVQFATKHNLRIVIKNTGHDLLGRSSGNGGFALWTHRLKELTLHKTFIPHGCEADERLENVVTAGAGVILTEVYKFAHDHRRYVIGGASRSVGIAGGFTFGGGHSYLSAAYGLGADQVVEVEIVTPDGQLRKISRCSEPDLFWAVRGGGGGTWGASVRVSYKSYPESTIFQFDGPSIGVNSTNETFAEVLEQYVADSPKIQDLGIGGASTVAYKSLNINSVAPEDVVSYQDFKSVWSNFVELLIKKNLTRDENTGLDGSPLFKNYTSWYDFYTTTLISGPEPEVGPGGSVASRLIPRHYFENDSKGLTEVLIEGLKANPETLPMIIGVAGPSEIAQKANGFNTTSLTPAWYKSIWHLIPFAGIDAIRDYTPDGGAYFSESSDTEPEWTKAYWGDNYPRLLALKNKWDPENHFQVWHGVGASNDTSSETWKCYA